MLAALPILTLASAAQSTMPDFGPPSRDEMRVCIPASVRSSPSFEAIPPALRRQIVGCFVAVTVRHMNRQLPARIDPETTLVSVAATGAMLQYNYRIDRPAAAIGAAERADLASATRGRVCAHAGMRQTMGLGGSYRYVWADRTGRQVQQLLVARCP